MLGSGEALAASSEVEVEVLYTADVLENLDGGLRTGGAYLDNLDVLLTVDGARFGAPALSFHAHGMYNNAARFSERYSGDAFTVSNIDAPRAIRLYEAWVEWSFDRGASSSLRVGLYDLNSEFDYSEPRQLFLNSSFGVGHELAQSGTQGPSIFPVTSLGIRYAFTPAENWQLLSAVLDGVPGDPDDLTATTIQLRSDEGALLVAEIQRLEVGPLEKLALGVWHYTRRKESTDGSSTARDQGVYLSSDWNLRGALDGFFRIGRAARRVNDYVFSVSTGVNYDESLGLGMTWARTIESEDEAVVELTYRHEVFEWLTLQPNLQYAIQPAARTDLDNAWVLGLRFEVGRAFDY